MARREWKPPASGQFPPELRRFDPADWPGAPLPWLRGHPEAVEVWSAYARWRLARLDWAGPGADRWPNPVGLFGELRAVRTQVARQLAAAGISTDLADASPDVDGDARNAAIRASSAEWPWLPDNPDDEDVFVPAAEEWASEPGDDEDGAW